MQRVLRHGFGSGARRAFPVLVPVPVFRRIGKRVRKGCPAKYLNRLFRYMINSCYLYPGNAETGIQKRVTMINDKERMYLLPHLFNAAVRAGAAIMSIYKHRDDYDISLKSDRTPITVADRLAHRTIREYLGPTRIPILSEEGREMRYEERCNWELY